MAGSFVATNEISRRETVPLILDRLLVRFNGSSVEVSPDAILLGSKVTMPWDGSWGSKVEDLAVTVRAGSRLSIRVSPQIMIVVDKHVGDHSANKNDFLGFDIRNTDGWSEAVNGIIGKDHFSHS